MGFWRLVHIFFRSVYEFTSKQYDRELDRELFAIRKKIALLKREEHDSKDKDKVIEE